MKRKNAWPAEHYVHGEGPGRVVVIPARVAHRLDNAALNKLRRECRGIDPDVDAVLVAIRLVGLEWEVSVTGRDPRKSPESMPTSRVMSSVQAADAIGVCDRTIRQACADGRLRATRQGGRWSITAEELTHFQASRGAA